MMELKSGLEKNVLPKVLGYFIFHHSFGDIQRLLQSRAHFVDSTSSSKSGVGPSVSKNLLAVKSSYL